MRWIALLALLAPAAWADDQVVYAYYLSPNEVVANASISFQCDRLPGNEMDCWFTRLYIRHRVEAHQVQAETDTVLADFRKEIKELGLAAYVKKFCFEPGEVEEIRRAIEKSRARGATKSAAAVAGMLEICTNPTAARFEAYLRAEVLASSKTCVVGWYRDGRIRLKPAAAGRWIGQGTPHGCKREGLFTLQRHPEYASTWSVTLTLDANAASSEHCQMAEKISGIKFSWGGYKPQLSCESVEFDYF